MAVVAEKRKAYDASRGFKRSAFDEEAEAADEAFEEAIHDYDERRDTACSVYPDLRKLKSSLAKTSQALAFGLVVPMLESKQFERRDGLVRLMKRSFL